LVAVHPEEGELAMKGRRFAPWLSRFVLLAASVILALIAEPGAETEVSTPRNL
jgi:hypothetical protein